MKAPGFARSAVTPEPVANAVVSTPSLPRGNEVRRAEARRAQVLAAAAECFRRDGFHGGSIAAISKAAGMSVGHIYHYFANKEAIIAGIVAQDLERVLATTQALRAAPDVLGALLGGVAAGVAQALDPDAAALKLEIVAEASRNEHVASIVRGADAEGLASFADTLRSLRRARGRNDTDEALLARAETIAALVEGLMVRRIRNPGLDRGALTATVQRVIRFLAEEDALAGEVPPAG